MKKNTKWLSLIGVLVFGVVISYIYLLSKPTSSSTTSSPQNTTTTSSDSLTISNIKENRPESGIYQIQGYVVKKYTCPPCSQGAQCKPCMRNNIVISEDNDLLESYNLSDRELIVFTENPNLFELKKRYQFTLKITNSKSTNEQLNDIELIAFK